MNGEFEEFSTPYGIVLAVVVVYLVANIVSKILAVPQLDAGMVLWVVVGVPMLSVTLVWKQRRGGRREDFGFVEAALLWTAVSQMVVAFGLAGWIVVPDYRVAAPIPTVLGTELLGMVAGTAVVIADYALWLVSGWLPSRTEQAPGANQRATDKDGES